MISDWKPIGRLSHLCRYPLKAAGGEEIDVTKIGWHGLTHDRNFALLRIGDMSGLPWVSARQFPQLLAWKASIPPGSTDLHITSPDSDWILDPKDNGARGEFAEHATKLLGEPVLLVNLWTGAFDSMPISIITSATMAASGRLVGEELDPRRFRANIIIDTDNPRDWPERQWLGHELRLGDNADSPVLRIDRHTSRCEVLDLHPDTGTNTTTGLFNAVRDANRNRAGSYATPRHVGHTTTGTTVWIR